MPHNLDQEAMTVAGTILQKCAQYEATEVENLATKGLGVLLEQGVYAGLLFFYTQRAEKASAADEFVKELMKSARGLKSAEGQAPAWTEVLQNLDWLAKNVCNELHRTLLVKKMWEQTLTYVRYGARALEKTKK